MKRHWFGTEYGFEFTEPSLAESREIFRPKIPNWLSNMPNNRKKCLGYRYVWINSRFRGQGVQGVKNGFYFPGQDIGFRRNSYYLSYFVENKNSSKLNFYTLNLLWKKITKLLKMPILSYLLHEAIYFNLRCIK